MAHFQGIQFLCFLLCVSSVVLKIVKRAPPAPPLDMAMEEDQMRAGSCADKMSYCGGWKAYCKMAGYTGYMEENCMKTCGACSRLDLPKCDNSMVNKPTEDFCEKQRDPYCDISEDNTMCKYCGVNEEKCGKNICNLGITDPAEIAVIVDRHNKHRRSVSKGLETKGNKGKKGQPPAANMMEVQWDGELAKMAQTWVNQCSGAHDKNRDVKNGTDGYCGQNYAWMGTGSRKAKKDEPLKQAVDGWYDEVRDFDKDAIASFTSKQGKGGIHTGTVGHYTQVIWAKVTKIGCGYIERMEGSYYGITVTCNYSPGGNWVGEEIYKEGEAGTACPPGSTNVDGLCRQK